MNIHVTRDGQDFGPFEIEAVNSYLRGGYLLKTDLAWHEGLPGWVPLHQIAGVQIPAMAVPPPLPVQPVVEPHVPRAVQPVVRPPVAQSVRPTAAGQKMKASTVIGIIAAIAFTIIRLSGNSNTTSSPTPSPRDEEQQQMQQFAGIISELARSPSAQAEAARRQAATDQDFISKMRDDRMRQEERASRADEVNRRLLGQPARSPFNNYRQ